MKTRDLLLDRVHTLPPLPGAAAKLVQQLQDPDVQMSAVSKVVELDPGLTANALKLANSVLFGGNHRIASVSQAINRIGLFRVYQLVVATVVGPMARQPLGGYDLAPEELWHHSLAVAACTRTLAGELKAPSDDDATTAGLLHDVGKVVLTCAFPEQAAASKILAGKSGQALLDAETETFGLDHAEAGGVLLEHWRFPETLVEAVRHHHEPGPQASLPTALVHAADVLCFQGGLGCSCAQPGWTLSPEIEARWPMDEARRLRILEGAKTDYEEMKRLFAGK